MIIREFFIAGGNSTALIYNSNNVLKNNISKKLIEKVEQVGFVDYKSLYPRLSMMGNELCINSTLAFASTLYKKGKLITSGLDDLVFYSNENNLTKINIPLKFKKNNNIILFDGIGFVIYKLEKESSITKLQLSNLCEQYNLPAFGALFYYKNKIIPYVYVKEIDSFKKESACGSGSIAFSLYSKGTKVIQPTGQTISIIKKADYFSVSARINQKEVRK